MKVFKKLKDQAEKFLRGKKAPQELFELNKYFRLYKGIDFKYHDEDGIFIAVSTNFHHGTIVTDADNLEELDGNIEDAILTAFGVPASYSEEANIHRIGDEKMGYRYATA